MNTDFHFQWHAHHEAHRCHTKKSAPYVVSVLLVGSIDNGEFPGVRSTLDEAGQIVQVSDSPAAINALAAGPFAPEVIVLAQSYPGQFNAEEIEQMRRLAPLSRILGVLGSWCEGEMRSGKPLPGVVRIYWHQWAVRWRGELGQLQQGHCPAWGLPPTTIEEDRLLAGVSEPQPARADLIVIFGRQPHVTHFLAAACQALGHSTVSLYPPWKTAEITGARAALVDAAEYDAAAGQESLARLVRMLAPTPVIALFDFLRVADQAQALQAGVAAILSKPLLLDDLARELNLIRTPSAAIKVLSQR